MLRDLGTWVENELTLDQELVQAREVQRRLLPRRAPDVPMLDVAGRCVPASDVGGDFYDWQVSNGQLQVMLADVMGKGITAAIVAAGVRAVMRGTSRYNDLRSSLQRTAVSMQEDLDEVSTFVTMFAVRADPATGHLEYVDAGHGLALILSPDGASRQLRTPGLPIGAVPGDSWESATDVLAEGETLLLVSDGVLDAFPNVTRAIEAAEYIAEEGLSAAALVVRVIALFSHQSQPDDVTVVAVVRNSTG
jgi:serine phosphatase RsbU (regulator of sigma subunit)